MQILVASSHYLFLRLTKGIIMGWLSKLFGRAQQKTTPIKQEPRQYFTRDMLKTDSRAAQPQPISGTMNRLYAAHDQTIEMRRNTERLNRQIAENSVTKITVYVYDPRPLQGVRTGQTIICNPVSRRIELVSPLTGSTWQTGDDGMAYEYNGQPFGVIFAKRSLAGATSVKMRRTGTQARNFPTMVALIQKEYSLQDTARFVPKNTKPSGREMLATVKVDLVGEENAQQILEQYGDDALVWATIRRGEIPKGKTTGEPTIFVTIDGIDVGWLTATQGSRHHGQIPPEGAVCLARIKQGSKKLEVTISLPDWK
jgi:hypothetical protein